MARVIPYKKYTLQDITRMRQEPSLEKLVLKGFVLRANPDGTVQFVPWQHSDNADTGGGEGRIDKGLGRIYRERRPRANVGLKAKLPPIVKRTPQQRVDSLMLRFIDDCKKHGTVPGLTDPMIRTIVDAAWVSGKTEITGEVVRQVAQHFLEQAEAKAERDNYKRVVRPSPTD